MTRLTKDQDALLTFYNSRPSTGIICGRPTPIESVFATVRHRTVRTKGSLPQTSARLMVFMLVMAASRTWKRLRGENQLPKLVLGITFRDSVEVIVMPAQSSAA